MERLTQRDFNLCDNCSAGTTCEHFCDPSFPPCGEKAIYERLKAYEETGLEPKQVRTLQEDITGFIFEIDEYRAIGSIDHLRELVQAEKEGRLVVLPCKAGDAVYKIEGKTILPMVAKWIDTFVGEFMVAIQYVPRAPEYHSLDDFGKSVFLTREDAEAALEAQKGGEGNAYP